MALSAYFHLHAVCPHPPLVSGHVSLLHTTHVIFHHHQPIMQRQRRSDSGSVSRVSSNVSLSGLGREASYPPLKLLGLKFVNARVHFLLALSRVSLHSRDKVPRSW